MRWDWESIRPRERCPSSVRSSVHFSRSEYPRIAASGVRSSWEASATNSRTRSSERCRPLSAESTFSSIRFSACPTAPTSVLGRASAGATRVSGGSWPAPRSSWETSVATAETRSSGFMVRRIAQEPSSPASTRAAALTPTVISSRVVRVRSMSAVGSPVMTVCPLASFSASAR